MHEAYLNLNGVRTLVTAHGKWVEETLTGNKNVIIIIPGNPGIPGFYSIFAKTLNEKLGYPVWCIGHAGQNIPDRSIFPFPKLSENPEVYGLKGQIESKVCIRRKSVLHKPIL